MIRDLRQGIRIQRDMEFHHSHPGSLTCPEYSTNTRGRHCTSLIAGVICLSTGLIEDLRPIRAFSDSGRSGLLERGDSWPILLQVLPLSGRWGRVGYEDSPHQVLDCLPVSFPPIIRLDSWRAVDPVYPVTLVLLRARSTAPIHGEHWWKQ